MRPRSARIDEDRSTPGAFAAASPAAVGKPDQPFWDVTIHGAGNWPLIALSIEPWTPLPSTATNETSASPIISAAAVDAVLDGFRTAFSDASAPAAPPNLREGQPRTVASSVTRRDATPAVPEISARAPNASASSELPEPSRLPVTAYPSESAASTSSATPTRVALRLRTLCGRTP